MAEYYALAGTNCAAAPGKNLVATVSRCWERVVGTALSAAKAWASFQRSPSGHEVGQ